MSTTQVARQEMIKQSEIIEALGVRPDFDATQEIAKRVAFLKSYLVESRQSAYVLGISGGVDSLTAGLLAQRAVQELRADGRPAAFIAVRLPYGVQADEHDASAAVNTIRPDRTMTVDIKPAADNLMAAVLAGGSDPLPRHHFILGNVKARQRMVAQYTIAGIASGIVIGTDHAAEALMGFYTKFGDGAADVLPLAASTSGGCARWPPRSALRSISYGRYPRLISNPMRRFGQMKKLTASLTSKLTTSWKDGPSNRPRKRGS